MPNGVLLGVASCAEADAWRIEETHILVLGSGVRQLCDRRLMVNSRRLSSQRETSLNTLIEKTKVSFLHIVNRRPMDSYQALLVRKTSPCQLFDKRLTQGRDS